MHMHYNNNNNNNNPICKAPECQNTSVALEKHYIIGNVLIQRLLTFLSLSRFLRFFKTFLYSFFNVFTSVVASGHVVQTAHLTLSWTN